MRGGRQPVRDSGVPAAEDAVLAIRDLGITLPTRAGMRRLVDGVDLTVGQGEIVGLAGESGSGKTLTALSVLGMTPPGSQTSGTVAVEGRDVLAMRRRQLQRLRGDGVAMVFQDPSTALHPMLDIGTQLTEHQRVHLGVSRAAARRRALELLEQVRLPDPARVMDSFPHQFSGGMKQRIAIAIALACGPRLLIADEPTTALDVTVQAGILRLIDQLRRDTGMAVLFITHDLAVMNVTADRLYIMYAGRVVESGDTRPLLSAPRHPYTRALLDALPEGEATDADGHPNPLTPIPGEPASPEARPPGCAFHPRCTHAEPGCRREVPPLIAIGQRHGDIGRQGGASQRWLACPPDPFVPGRSAPAGPRGDAWRGEDATAGSAAPAAQGEQP